MHPIRNTYCTELLCQESSVSFSENIGRGDTRSREKSKIKANSIHGFSIRKAEYDKAIPAQNKALAGTAKPMKELVCLSSRLNIPNRKAENTGMRKARNFQ